MYVMSPIQKGVHWPDLDENISVDNLLTGACSGESQRSECSECTRARQHQPV